MRSDHNLGRSDHSIGRSDHNPARRRSKLVPTRLGDACSDATQRPILFSCPVCGRALGVPELQVAICHMPWIGLCQRQAFGGAYSETVAYVNPVFYSQLWSMLGREALRAEPERERRERRDAPRSSL